MFPPDLSRRMELRQSSSLPSDLFGRSKNRQFLSICDDPTIGFWQKDSLWTSNLLSLCSMTKRQHYDYYNFSTGREGEWRHSDTIWKENSSTWLQVFQEMLEKKEEGEEEEEEEEVQHVGVCWLLPITDQKRRRKCGDNKRTSTLMYNSFFHQYKDRSVVTKKRGKILWRARKPKPKKRSLKYLWTRYAN